jgi:hypothetical protein
MEILRYTTADGRDVFGEWLGNLADLTARARVAVRIDRLAGGTLEIQNRSAEACTSCVSIGGPDIACITGKSKPLASCFYAEETNGNRLPISRERGPIGRTTRKGWTWDETQSECFS